MIEGGGILHISRACPRSSRGRRNRGVNSEVLAAPGYMMLPGRARRGPRCEVELHGGDPAAKPNCTAGTPLRSRIARRGPRCEAELHRGDPAAKPNCTAGTPLRSRIARRGPHCEAELHRGDPAAKPNCTAGTPLRSRIAPRAPRGRRAGPKVKSDVRTSLVVPIARVAGGPVSQLRFKTGVRASNFHRTHYILEPIAGRNNGSIFRPQERPMARPGVRRGGSGLSFDLPRTARQGPREACWQIPRVAPHD